MSVEMREAKLQYESHPSPVELEKSIHSIKSRHTKVPFCDFLFSPFGRWVTTRKLQLLTCFDQINCWIVAEVHSFISSDNNLSRVMSQQNEIEAGHKDDELLILFFWIAAKLLGFSRNSTFQTKIESRTAPYLPPRVETRNSTNPIVAFRSDCNNFGRRLFCLRNTNGVEGHVVERDTTQQDDGGAGNRIKSVNNLVFWCERRNEEMTKKFHSVTKIIGTSNWRLRKSRPRLYGIHSDVGRGRSINVKVKRIIAADWMTYPVTSEPLLLFTFFPRWKWNQLDEGISLWTCERMKPKSLRHRPTLLFVYIQRLKVD